MFQMEAVSKKEKQKMKTVKILPNELKELVEIKSNIYCKLMQMI